MMIIKKKGRKYLYLKFFDITKQKTIERSTKLEDTLENREKIKKEIIPAIEAALKSQKPLSANKNLEDYINWYLKSKENLTTYFEIEAKTKIILKYFKNVNIKEISPLQCEEFILNLNLSTKTKRNYLNVLKGIFDTACKDLEIKDNPTQFIKLIKTQQELEKEDIQPFSKDEVDKLLKVSIGILRDYLGIGFYTGARSGEILALKIQDIDFENKTININSQFTKRVLKKSLKTKGSIRTIPLFESVIPYFKSLVSRAIKNKSFYLFSKDDEPNILYSIDNIRGKKQYGPWSKLLKRCNLEYRKIYQTRHTFAIHMLNSGAMTTSQIASILGHTSSKTMFDHYAKFIKGEQLNINRNIDIFAKKDTVDTLVDSRHFENNFKFKKEA